MKLRDGVEIIEIEGDTAVVPTFEERIDLRRIYRLNPVSRMLICALKTETDEEKLTDLFCENYDVSRQDAKRDISVFLNNIRELGFLEE
ncbi:MAG: PqqD family protein [Clostridia bacterium]|nr:PqqD family protein [Clostridia bacterium]